MDLSLSAVWVGESPKPVNFGVSPKTELLAKSTLLHGLTSATSAENVSTPLTPLKYGVEYSFTAGNQLMKSSNGLVFLPLLVVLGLLGLKTSLFLIHVGETDVATNVGLGNSPMDASLSKIRSRASSQSPKFVATSVSPT